MLFFDLFSYFFWSFLWIFMKSVLWMYNVVSHRLKIVYFILKKDTKSQTENRWIHQHFIAANKRNIYCLDLEWEEWQSNSTVYTQYRSTAFGSYNNPLIWRNRKLPILGTQFYIYCNYGKCPFAVMLNDYEFTELAMDMQTAE